MSTIEIAAERFIISNMYGGGISMAAELIF
jgi:hypothetical protein